MFLKRVEIENIRGIRRLVWEPKTGPGWHVILGDNASGKSSTLRAIALALVGASEATALRQSWDDWLRRDATEARISLNVVLAHPTPPRNAIAHLAFLRDGNHIWFRSEPTDPRAKTDDALWFSAAYGPFRRLRGGDKDAEKLYHTNPRLARHLTLFDESIALSECLTWLQAIKFKSLEANNRGDASGGEFGRLLERLKNFVNHHDLLPHGVRMVSVDSERVTFRDGNGSDIAVEELSDGFRSVLSLTFELIRQLVATYGGDNIFTADDPTQILAPGVVLIDEIDAHLHPQWQRRIGRWFTTCFPQIQFIVTTHSPLVCQAAIHGSVFRLPRPGSNEEPHFISGPELDRLLYGNILEAYETESFGLVETRSPEGQAKLQRLAELNAKALEEGLTPPEENERATLRAALPTEQGSTGDLA